MKSSRARSISAAPRRMLLGAGTGVLLVTLATGARGPVSGSLDAFVKPSARVPMAIGALPEVANGIALDIGRPPPSSPSASRLAEDATSSQIPAPALRAYRTAELIMQRSAPGCGLDWEILAGIGRVESDHGRYGGAVVAADGTSSPQIYGVPLNGAGPVAEIPDTDNGALDADTVWDRAIGPMQFLPTTWDVVGVDADGDGVKNPHDLDDAALAAAVYLCAGDVDLRDPAQLREALLRYNPSTEYADLVLSYIEAYRNSEPIPITVNPPVDEVTPLDEHPDQPVHTPHAQPEGQPQGDPSNNGPGSNGPGTGPGGADPGNGPGGETPGEDPDGEDPGGEDPGGGPGDPGGPGGGGSPGPGDDDPGGPRPGDGGGGGGGDDPDPEPPDEMTGVLLYNPNTGVWSIEGYEGQLYFGTEEEQAQPSAADFDGDGDSTETVRAELDGFVADGVEITVGVAWSNATTASVHTLNGKEYPGTGGNGEPTEPPPTEPTPSEPSPTEPTASDPTPTEPTPSQTS
jgi:Transglycosylase SLT domain